MSQRLFFQIVHTLVAQETNVSRGEKARQKKKKKKNRQTNITTPFSSEMITYNVSTICRHHYAAAFFRIGRSTIVQVHTTNCNSINTINITAIGTAVSGATIPSGKGVDSTQAFTTLKLKGQSTLVMRRFCVLFQIRRRRRGRKKWKRKKKNNVTPVSTHALNYYYCY